MNLKHILVILSILLFTSHLQAQNPLLALLGNSAGSEERLLFKKPAGPYEITIDGERLLERAYFRIDIRQDGLPIADTSEVTVEITPPAIANATDLFYTAVFDADTQRFVVDPLNFGTAKTTNDDNWLVTVTVNSEAGEGSTTFGTQVYAPKPKQSTVFSIINVILPLVVLALFGGIYALRGVRLEQNPTTV